MADDLQNYQLQLQQVEAALLTDPDNEELKKLKNDLEEVIELTLDLKLKAEAAANAPEYTEPVGLVDDDDEEDEITKSLLAVEQFVAQNKAKRKWKVGDTCMAKSSENGEFYEATIDAISTDGQVNVTFANFKNRGVTTVMELKDYNGQRRMGDGMKKGKINKEYLKKKKLKKQQRFKELEEERESDKKKWLTFASKALKNKKSGITTKSIFASPESVSGRVGIGTCGISGKGMTEFTTAEKWRKGV